MRKLTFIATLFIFMTGMSFAQKSPLLMTQKEFQNQAKSNPVAVNKSAVVPQRNNIKSVSVPGTPSSIWYFGTNAGLDFKTDPPTILTDGQITTTEGCAVISDATGNLLFSTDGITIWAKDQTVMPNGSGLLGDPSSTESAIIVPSPGNANQYYVFTVSADYSGTNTNVTYSIVDMTLNSGKGDVVAASKNSTLLLHTDEVVTAIPASNGNYYWIVTKQQVSNSYYAYQLTSTGINSTPVITNIGVTTVNVGLGGAAIGYMKANAAGTKIVHVYYDNVSTGLNTVDVFDFNAATGVLSNYNAVDALATPYGCEFSPNGNLLYVASFQGTGIYQYDLTNSNAKYQVSTSTSAADMQNAVNGKMYVANMSGTTLDIIANPNVVGAGCNYSAGAQDLGGKTCMGGLPNMISSYSSQISPTLDVCTSTNITVNSATLQCNVISDGGAAITERGFYYGTSPAPTTNKTIVSGTTGAMSADITSLTINTQYYFRAYATNSIGTTYSEDADFTTQAAAPNYTVNFATAETNETVPATDEYSTSSDMSDAVSGADAVIPLTPGVDVYFRTKATTTTIASAILHLTVPSIPASPTVSDADIDFISGNFNNVDNTMEYSIDGGTTWSPVTDININIQDYWPIGGDLLVRYTYTSTDFASNSVTITIPAAPDAPTNSVQNDITNTFGFDLVPGYPTLDLYEYSLDGGNTISEVTSNPIIVGNISIPIGNLSVNVKAVAGVHWAGLDLWNTAEYTVGTVLNVVSNSEISVYPNPSKGIFIIQTSRAYSLKITDMTGKIILVQKVTNQNQQFDLSRFAKGIYNIQIVQDGNITVRTVSIN
jgi:hypothetical protein